MATSEQITATSHRDFDMGFESVQERGAHAVPAHERGWSVFRDDREYRDRPSIANWHLVHPPLRERIGALRVAPRRRADMLHARSTRSTDRRPFQSDKRFHATRAMIELHRDRLNPSALRFWGAKTLSES